jgi:hypothetical protein
MTWFLPLGVGVGVLLTMAAVERRQAAKRDRRSRDWWLFLLLGWIPLLAWLASQFVEHY